MALIVTALIGAQVVRAPAGIAAGCTSTGTVDGDYTVMTFRGAGTCSWTPPAGLTVVDVLVVGGGGGGGGGSQERGLGGLNGDFNAGGGGGGGQVTLSESGAVSGTVTVTVGAGGSGGSQPANPGFPYQATAGAAGGVSSFGSVSASGGGGGGTGEYLDPPRAAGDGGASGRQVNGVSTNTTGGLNDWVAAGGGAGAGDNGSVGADIAETAGVGGAGGGGTSSDITGSATTYGGGGGGGGVWVGTGSSPSDGSGGLGGSGGGGNGAQLPGTVAANGVDGLGGGGGGGGYTDETASGNGARGGEGVVVIRYATTGDLVVTTAPGNTVVGGALTAPVVQIQDGNGNAIPVAGVIISATLTTGVGTLTNTTATTDTSGAATFAGFTLNASPSNYIVTFRANLLTSATSAIQITPAPIPDNGGSSGPPPSPVPPSETTSNVSPPDPSTVTIPAPESLAPGGTSMTFAGQPVTVQDQPLRRGQGLSLSAGPVSMRLSSTTTNGRAVPLAPDGSLLLARSGDLPITASGLAPGSIVTQTLFSDPITLGTATANATGELASTVTIPSTVPLGSHTLRLQGTTNTGDPFTLDMGVTVATPAVALGASPILVIKQATIKGTRVLDLRARGLQARCLVTFTAKRHKAKARADRTGIARAHITLPNQSKRGVIVTARVTGKGCAPVQVTRRT